MQGRTHGEAPGDIGQDVHPTEALDDLVGQGRHRVGVEQIDDKDRRLGPRWEVRLGGVQGRLAAVHQGDTGPGGGEGLGQGPTEVTGGPGDDGDFA